MTTAVAARRAAASELTAGGAVSYPAVADAARRHALGATDLRLLLRDLLDAGAAVPEPLLGLASPVQLLSEDAIPAVRPPDAPAVAEVLDLSRIRLADLRPVPVTPALDRPVPRPETGPRLVAVVADEEEEEENTADLDLLALYRAQTMRYPLLSAAEEVELAVAMADGDTAAAQAASHRFASANLRLVMAIAVHYVGRGVDLPDLVQEGNLGLLRAVRKFDHRQGTRFSTYASWWIRQSLSRAVADNARTIRYPVHVVEDLAAAARAAGSTTDEVARARGLPGCVPLDRAAEVLDQDELHDLHHRYGAAPAPDLRGFDHEQIQRALRQCSDRERRVLERRYGFAGDPATLEVIGTEFGVTRERIRQIETAALRKVRTVLRRGRQAGE